MEDWILIMVTRTIKPVTGGAPGTDNAAMSQAKPNENESLDTLAEIAAGTVDAAPQDGAPGEPSEAQAAAILQSAADDMADVLLMVREMAAPLVEEMGYLKPGQTLEIWTDQKIKAIAGPAIAIMERNGISLGETMGQFGPYALLIVALWGPGAATYKAVQVNKATPVNDSQ